MILKSSRVGELLSQELDDPLVITPQPNLQELKEAGSASIDLRLGTWFLTLKQSRMSLLAVRDTSDGSFESRLTRRHYVPFGKDFILHPRNFVLGATLEWIRLPKNIAGYVVGKSSWGRHGLVIATATGVHPGFSGCLTLEITNLGEIPIAIRAGMKICQIFLHYVESSCDDEIDKSSFMGQRRPSLGTIRTDRLADKLRKASE